MKEFVRERFDKLGSSETEVVNQFLNVIKLSNVDTDTLERLIFLSEVEIYERYK